MKYFFVLGRNPELSYAEICAFLQTKNKSFDKIYFKENILVLNFKEGLDLDIQSLGGTIMLGNIEFEGNSNEFQRYLNDWFVKEEKFSYSLVGNYKDKVHQILDIKFRREKVKARFKGATKKLSLQNGSFVEFPSGDKVYFYLKKEDLVLFGESTQKYDPEQTEFRDMNKPFRREELAIDPKLARILINLSGAEKDKTFLDPFCGIGVFLQEAALLDMNVIGVDIDKKATEQAKENLIWLQENYNKKFSYRLIKKDSKDLEAVKFDCVATEPNLGELVKKKFSDEDAKKYLSKFQKFIIPILKNIKNLKNPEGKIAITFPRVRNFSVDLEAVCQETGLKVSNLKDTKFPIREFRKDNFVEREVILLE